MNKKEISEIKKQFDPKRTAITRIRGCYVDHEKAVKATMNRTFLSLPEEESSKYFTLFKNTLSGTVGKNLINMEFPLISEEEGGTQNFLLKLRNSKLEDDDLVNEFYQKIIDSYSYGENYLILLIHAAYDVPGKASDGMEMVDASDLVYSHILCTICPVNLLKSALYYNELDNCFEERSKDWMVEAPMHGFLFPAFNDRRTDIHGLLYYTKNTEELRPDFIDAVLGCQEPLSSKTQKAAFQTIIEDTLGEECNFEAIKTIHEQLTEIMEEQKENPAPVVFDKHDIKRLLENTSVNPEQMEYFDDYFEDATASKDSTFAAPNIVNSSSFDIKTPDVTVKVKPAMTHLVTTQVIDGNQCLVIQLNSEAEVLVNGIHIKTQN